MVVPWIWDPIPKTQVNCQKAKKSVFGHFLLSHCKKNQMAANRTILILEGLPMAHLKAYVPNFPKHMRERSQSLKLWVLDLSEVR